MNIDPDRLKHSLAVARKMVEIGKNKELTEKELQELFVLGYNNDIGYEFVDNNLDHGIVGGEILKESTLSGDRNLYDSLPNAYKNNFSYEQFTQIFVLSEIELVFTVLMNILRKQYEF